MVGVCWPSSSSSSSSNPPCVIYSPGHPAFLLLFPFFFECDFDDAWLRGYLSGTLVCLLLLVLHVHNLFYDAILGEKLQLI